ncbi:hypothetical protein LSH36_806g02017 [Paralvinella palmiformis]|uniref:Uncharacterized protein n=1 Tax=Paralvinella palmiformis TaxID=53620 RepID=A0AAD9MUW6_9ANNE|nr:hypothetical protein LSH36_806g02017 [Paralvinella palmiformis]
MSRPQESGYMQATYKKRKHVKHIPFDSTARYGDTYCGWVNSFSSEGKHWEVVKNEQVGDQKVQYPLLLCVLGSGGGGIKTFPELIDLATKGDGSHLHIQIKHQLFGAGDVYDKIPGDFMVYSFGQAASKDRENFSKEDIAAALVGMLAEDLAQTCHLTAASHNISHLYLCGSVVGASPYIRQHMKTILSVRDILNSQSKQYHSYFLKFGGYYGAIGALLKTLKPNVHRDDALRSHLTTGYRPRRWLRVCVPAMHADIGGEVSGEDCEGPVKHFANGYASSWYGTFLQSGCRSHLSQI